MNENNVRRAMVSMIVSHFLGEKALVHLWNGRTVHKGEVSAPPGDTIITWETGSTWLSMTIRVFREGRDPIHIGCFGYGHTGPCNGSRRRSAELFVGLELPGFTMEVPDIDILWMGENGYIYEDEVLRPSGLHKMLFDRIGMIEEPVVDHGIFN